MIRSVSFGNLYSSFLNSQNQRQNEQKQDLINRNYNEIYAHEAAHKAAGGALAGAIVIEKNAEGIPVGGHVDIKMPSLNPSNPQKTIDDANTVIRSAMAPSDPSDQDFRVASQARSIKFQAQGILNKKAKGKRLDYNA